MPLRGRKALISGGASGIGRAIAAQLAAAAVPTLVADVQPPHDVPDAVHFCPCDVASAADVHRLFTEVQNSLGPPDILVCSAGQGIHEKAHRGRPGKMAAGD